MVCKPNIWSQPLLLLLLAIAHYPLLVVVLENTRGAKVVRLLLPCSATLCSSPCKGKRRRRRTNYLNSIKFTINNLLLDYLNNEGNYLLKHNKEKDFQRAIILKIASTFSKVPFYLNVHAD